MTMAPERLSRLQRRILAWLLAEHQRLRGLVAAAHQDGPNLARTKILAKYNTVNQVDRLHGGTKPAYAVRE
jgi:hypothetical protein